MCSRTEADDGWKAKYNNDSRPWLITGKVETVEYPPTTMQESFLPTEPSKKPIGPRRELLEKFLIKEVSEQLITNITKEPDEEKRVSEYDEQFYKDGFDKTQDIERTEQDLQNYLKYPLYYDAPRTTWTDKLNSLPGKTHSPSVKPMAIFRKSAAFTKPLNLVYDIPKPGSIGYM